MHLVIGLEIQSLSKKTKKTTKNKKQILYNLIKNNTVVAICFYKVHMNNLLALKRASFKSA